MNKSTIRQIYKQKRLELTKQEVQEESKIIADNFITNLLPKIPDFSKKKLAFYVATNNEVDPIFILEHCQKLGNIITMPKIIPKQLMLDFKTYKIGDKLINNKLYPKLLEPEESKQNIVPDIIFVPLVAFDKNCSRVGMGGGFYDATINYFRHKNSQKIFIGLGYEWQNCSEISPEKQDQSLDFIVSKNSIPSCKQ